MWKKRSQLKRLKVTMWLLILLDRRGDRSIWLNLMTIMLNSQNRSQIKLIRVDKKETQMRREELKTRQMIVMVTNPSMRRTNEVKMIVLK